MISLTFKYDFVQIEIIFIINIIASHIIWISTGISLLQTMLNTGIRQINLLITPSEKDSID